MPLTLADFDYELPHELIAQHSASVRSSSRLLRLAGETLSDHFFSELPDLLAPGDLLVFNDTKVIKARLYGEKSSGGRIEVLIERVLGAHEALAQVRASKAPKTGARLSLEGSIAVEVTGRREDLFELRFQSREPVLELLERHGKVPLPPYITHAPDAQDESRYQTVYARAPGAVAAPTAGLHFDSALMERLAARGVRFAWLTLHVGAGTFQPVRAEKLEEHRMHPEWYLLPRETCAAVLEAKSTGASVIAVGTTSVRVLESAATEKPDGKLELGPGAAETRLFILPGFRFRVVDRLITNFHLPRSSLLMLVCALGGMEPVRRAYAHAVRQRYRFYSYGDAMLVDRIA